MSLSVCVCFDMIDKDKDDDRNGSPTRKSKVIVNEIVKKSVDDATIIKHDNIIDESPLSRHNRHSKRIVKRKSSAMKTIVMMTDNNHDVPINESQTDRPSFSWRNDDGDDKMKENIDKNEIQKKVNDSVNDDKVLRVKRKIMIDVGVNTDAPLIVTPSIISNQSHNVLNRPERKLKEMPDVMPTTSMELTINDDDKAGLMMMMSAFRLICHNIDS